MSYRQIMIAKTARLGVNKEQLHVNCEGQDYHLPLTDIGIIILESTSILLSSALISACSKHNVAIICCDEMHMPTATLLAYNQHYRPYYMLEKQMAQTTQIKAMLAEQVLKRKIQNQKDVLRYCQRSQKTVELLEHYQHELSANDEDNREGTAAKVFFHALYGGDFVRFEDDYINHVQNYGYAIFRSSLANIFSSYGFTLFLGFNHVGQTNAWNLVYDMIEPYRPLIDYYAFFNNHSDYESELTLQTKKELVQLLNAPVIIDGTEYTVQYSFEILAKSYLNFLETGEPLVLPHIMKVNFDVLLESV